VPPPPSGTDPVGRTSLGEVHPGQVQSGQCSMPWFPVRRSFATSCLVCQVVTLSVAAKFVNLYFELHFTCSTKFEGPGRTSSENFRKVQAQNFRKLAHFAAARHDMLVCVLVWKFFILHFLRKTVSARPYNFVETQKGNGFTLQLQLSRRSSQMVVVVANPLPLQLRSTFRTIRTAEGHPSRPRRPRHLRPGAARRRRRSSASAAAVRRRLTTRTSTSTGASSIRSSWTWDRPDRSCGSLATQYVLCLRSAPLNYETMCSQLFGLCSSCQTSPHIYTSPP
jgi:hypothetical protein